MSRRLSEISGKPVFQARSMSVNEIQTILHATSDSLLLIVELLGPQSTYTGRDETGSVYLPTQLERTLQLYW